MVSGNDQVLAALLMEAEVQPFALGVVVGHAHRQGRAHPGKGIRHHGDQRPVPQPHQSRCVDAVEQAAGLGCGQHRRLACLDHLLWPPDRRGRVAGDHLAHHQPVKELAQAGQVLLDRGRRIGVGQLLDVGGHMQGPDGRKGQPMSLTLVGKAIGGRHRPSGYAACGCGRRRTPKTAAVPGACPQRGAGPARPQSGPESAHASPPARLSVWPFPPPVQMVLITTFMRDRQDA